MPQELHVVQCFSCRAFQVDIVKKVPKWICKLCGEKQSLIKVYGTGTGKECRLIVQKLNEFRLNGSSLQDPLLSTLPLEQHKLENVPILEKKETGQSKWLEFTHEILPSPKEMEGADGKNCNEIKKENIFESNPNELDSALDF